MEHFYFLNSSRHGHKRTQRVILNFFCVICYTMRVDNACAFEWFIVSNFLLLFPFLTVTCSPLQLLVIERFCLKLGFFKVFLNLLIDTFAVCRPLSEAMITYARKDTHYLLEIFSKQRANFLANDRAEMLEAVWNESRQLCLSVSSELDL